MRHRTDGLIKELQKSGLSQKEFCAKHSISVSTLQYHLKKNRVEHSEKPRGFISILPSFADHPFDTIVVARGKFSAAHVGQVLRALGS